MVTRDDYLKLNHTYRDLPSGGEVIVIDKGAIINPESEAMLQALHSRSTGGFRDHLKRLIARGAENFMSSFYVGYGHKSIGDCGTTTMFVEGISMLAAKAIQDNPLYSGQEASTRYIDFSKQPFIDPTNSNEGENLQEMQRDFYLNAMGPTIELLKQKHPIQEGEKPKIYEKAILARAFDVTRSLLPSGASTNMAWHSNLRQAADKILFLRHHPLEEVRKIGVTLEDALREHHPSSFGHKRYDQTENYQDLIASRYLYHDSNSPTTPQLDLSKIDLGELEEYRDLLDQRPAKTELPKYLANAGIAKAQFRLDFGSFRDIQRHRAIIQRMPLITNELGFNEWYVQSLPDSIRKKLPEHLENINSGIEKLGVSKEVAQYFLPMGYDVSNKFTGDLPGLIYMIELRDSRFVHPTLQKVAHELGEKLSSELNIPLHIDAEPNRFDVKRGEHDIVEIK